MNRKLFDLLALFGFCTLVYWLSDQPRLPTITFFSNQDKILHACIYAVMAVLAWRCFSHAVTKRLVLFAATVAYCSVFGISDEWHQSFVPNRIPDIHDWLADTAGATASSTVLLLSRPRRRKPKPVDGSFS